MKVSEKNNSDVSRINQIKYKLLILSGNYPIHLIEFDFLKSTSCVMNSQKFDIFNKAKVDFNWLKMKMNELYSEWNEIRIAKQKFELIWERLWDILLDNYKIRQEKSVGSMSEKLEMTSNFFKYLFESSFCEWEVGQSQRHIPNPVKHLRWSFL